MSGEQHGRGRRRAPLVPAVWLLVWLTVAAAVVLPYVHSYRHLSPFDELVHVDYVAKAQQLEFVHGGERVGQTAMREQACRGHDIESIEFPPCRSEVFDPMAFPEQGFNTAYPDPPAYYVVTAGVATVVDLVPGVDSMVTAARSVGVLWLGLALALTFLLARRLGASRWPAAGATLVIASTPAIAHATATITSDAATLAAGALLCLVALEVVEGRARWLWLLPAAFAAGMVKATTLTVIGVVVVFLLLQLRSKHVDAGETQTDRPGRDATRPPPRRLVLGALATIAGGVLALGGWTVLTSLTAFSAADDIPMRDAFRVESLNWVEHIAPNIMALLTPIRIGYLPPFMQDYNLALVMGIVDVVLIAALAAVSWFGASRALSTRMAIATLAGTIISGPALVLLIYVGSHTYIPIPQRYGLSLMPAVAACLAVAASRRRAGGPVLLALGTVGLMTLLLKTL